MPGSGVETFTEEEASLVAALVAGGRGTAEIEAALADLRAGRGTVTTVGPPGAPVPPGAVPLTGVIGGVPTGIPTRIRPNDDDATRNGIDRQNRANDELAARGYEVTRNPTVLPSDNLGPNKNPASRLGAEIFDIVAPISPNPASVRSRIAEKVGRQQAFSIVVVLEGEVVTPEQVVDALRRDPVPGLREVLIFDQDGLGRGGILTRFVP